MLALRKKSPVIEIARIAGVSKAAAYATLNPETSGNIGIAEDTRKRILDAAAQIGYVRNELASSLVTGRSRTIGVCVQSLHNHFFGNFSSILDTLAYADGYSMMIASSEYDGERELRNLRNFAAKRADAIVVAYSDCKKVGACLPELASSGVRVLTIGNVRFEGSPSICFDEAAAALIQAQHLFDSGHRKAVHLNAACAKDLTQHIHKQRRDNFLGAWSRISGFDARSIEASNSSYPDPAAVSEIIARFKAGELDSVACAADTLAMGLISSLCVCGIKVPEDIAVIGLDDLDSSASFFVPLTTVRLPTDKLAEEIWGALKKLLSGESFEAHITVNPELVIRKST